MRRLLTLILAFSTGGTIRADQISQEVLNRLESLQRQVMEQQAEINSLKARMTEMESSTQRGRQMEESIDTRGLAQVMELGPVTRHRPQIEGIELKGEMELGFLRERYSPAGSHRRTTAASSYYTILRLGALWHTNEGWEIGAGLVTGWLNRTGSLLDSQTIFADEGHTFHTPMRHHRRNTWSRWQPFESGAIGLDYAYARHRLDVFSLTIGQQHNPFRSAPILWDQDIRPAGITAQYDLEGVFATAGWYEVLNMRVPDLDMRVQMWGGQIGYGMDLESFDWTVAGAYYHYNVRAKHDFENEIPIIDRTNNYRMDTVDLFAEAGTYFEAIRLTAHGQIWHNLSAWRNDFSQTLNRRIRPAAHNTGWTLGVSGEFAGLRAGYLYGCVGSDSFLWPLVNEFMRVNTRGHKFELGYQLTPHMRINTACMLLNEIQGRDRYSNYMFNLNYQF